MSGVYLDAVLDDEMQPYFNGTLEETVNWLLANSDHPKATQVCIGKTMRCVSIDDYLLEYDRTHPYPVT